MAAAAPVPASDDEAAVCAGTGHQDPNERPAGRWLRRLLSAKRPEPGALRASLQTLPAGSGDEALQLLAGFLPEDLTSLEVDVPGDARLTDKGVKALADALKKQRGLARLGLRCNRCSQLTDVSLQALASALASHADLSALSWDFSLCTLLADAGLNSLGELLERRAPAPPVEDGDAKIRPGSRESERTKSSKDSGQEPAQEMPTEKAPVELTRLELNFSGCTAITDDGMLVLGRNLARMTALTVLNLSMAGMGDLLTSQGFKLLFDGIVPLKNLEEVFLCFHDCTELFESSFITLCSSLTVKEELRKLHMNVQGCPAITTAALLFFQEPFKTSRKLEQIALNFTNCSMMMDRGLSEVVKFVKGLPELARFSLHVGGTQITADAVVNAELDLRHVEHLRISKLVRLPLGVGITGCPKR